MKLNTLSEQQSKDLKAFVRLLRFGHSRQGKPQKPVRAYADIASALGLTVNQV